MSYLLTAAGVTGIVWMILMWRDIRRKPDLVIRSEEAPSEIHVDDEWIGRLGIEPRELEDYVTHEAHRN